MLVTVNSCPYCGAPINPGRSGGICAACALGDALSDTTERFEGHELQEEIARGGMGVVYRARQLDPPRDVALKTLLSVGLRSPSALERFRLEPRAMASLQHPGILPVYVSGEQDGVPFFTMQLATGGTLAERSAEYAGGVAQAGRTSRAARGRRAVRARTRRVAPGSQTGAAVQFIADDRGPDGGLAAPGSGHSAHRGRCRPRPAGSAFLRPLAGPPRLRDRHRGIFG